MFQSLPHLGDLQDAVQIVKMSSNEYCCPFLQIRKAAQAPHAGRGLARRRIEYAQEDFGCDLEQLDGGACDTINLRI